ncbi:MAG: F0F1 ATP synthase subunit alpha [Clostridium sp.]|jgi:F-type H+-transporting ATPase subunit alpha|nr:F0F1 ATP synthase subunit alpha [Clostridium sp.]
MTSRTQKYITMLHNLQIPVQAVKQTQDILSQVRVIASQLSSPATPLPTKHRTIEHIFPESIRNFLKILCDNEEMVLWDEIQQAATQKNQEHKQHKKVLLTYVTPPTQEQIDGFLAFLEKEYQWTDEVIAMEEDAGLGSGFVLQVGSDVYDWSAKGRTLQLQEKLQNIKHEGDSTKNIISILKSEIEDFELEASNKEIGFVSWVGDGIAIITGVDHAAYGEILLFDSGIKGMVQDIRYNEIACILFGRDRTITEGSRVVRTGKMAGIPVGEACLSRVVDSLGAPIDGKGPIESSAYSPVEEPAPSIVDRKSVGVPMETGILAIDSMFPIGRGQRELIIGDRQTGKTSIAMDAIINQKGKDMICVYVAIGQKASTVAKLHNTLLQQGAMEYTIIVTSAASDPASLQYIAPYSGTAIAEYFMHQGKDVLIIYDDLSKHAVAYRALSLLMERSPGREAYPGDVFYLHSRLLERSARLTDERGGGSLTALPIIETQDGDVSAYIPTNVISITDGQIFLETDLFFAGMRPAVNVGLSVSRVGGAAQTKAMKKAAGSIRIDLAQFREMEVFTQFAADLDPATKEMLHYGHVLTQLLKQPLGNPLSMEEQVISLCAAKGGVMSAIDPNEINEVQGFILKTLREESPELLTRLRQLKDLSEELQEEILEAAKEAVSNYEVFKKEKADGKRA